MCQRCDDEFKNRVILKFQLPPDYFTTLEALGLIPAKADVWRMMMADAVPGACEIVIDTLPGATNVEMLVMNADVKQIIKIRHVLDKIVHSESILIKL